MIILVYIYIDKTLQDTYLVILFSSNILYLSWQYFCLGTVFCCQCYMVSIMPYCSFCDKATIKKKIICEGNQINDHTTEYLNSTIYHTPIDNVTYNCSVSYNLPIDRRISVGVLFPESSRRVKVLFCCRLSSKDLPPSRPTLFHLKSKAQNNILFKMDLSC